LSSIGNEKSADDGDFPSEERVYKFRGVGAYGCADNKIPYGHNQVKFSKMI